MTLPESRIQELCHRIDYCNDEISNLQRMIRDFFDQHLTQEIVPYEGGLALIGELSAEPSVSLRAKAGIIANELRATLDGLANDLAAAHSGRGGKTYFPISKTREIFNEDGKKKIKLLSLDDKQKIENLQPWKNGHSHLWRLHEADRVRKHQRLLTCSGTAYMDIPNTGSELSLILVDRGCIGGIGKKFLIRHWIPFLSGGEEMVPYFFMTYNEPETLAGADLCGFLEECSREVRSIIESFSFSP